MLRDRTCKECGHTETDLLEHWSNTGPLECPECHAQAAFAAHAPTVSLKFVGDGWTSNWSNGNMSKYYEECEKSTNIHVGSLK